MQHRSTIRREASSYTVPQRYGRTDGRTDGRTRQTDDLP